MKFKQDTGRLFRILKYRGLLNILDSGMNIKNHCHRESILNSITIKNKIDDSVVMVF